MNHRPPPSPHSFTARLGLQPVARSSSAAFNLPTVVLGLVAVISAVSIVEFFSPARTKWVIEVALGFMPYRLSTFFGTGGEAPQLLLPLVGHVFLHGGWEHLIFNMVMLMVFGAGVARRMNADWGEPGRVLINAFTFLLFFFACGIAGALTYFIRDADSTVTMIGASGAISGLMAAAMRFALRPLAPYGAAYGPLSKITEKPVIVASAAYIGINLLTAVGFNVVGAGGGQVAWDAHIGGYVFGLLAFPLFDRMVKRAPDPSDGVIRPTFH